MFGEKTNVMLGLAENFMVAEKIHMIWQNGGRHTDLTDLTDKRGWELNTNNSNDTNGAVVKCIKAGLRKVYSLICA